MPAILLPKNLTADREINWFRDTGKWQLGDVAYILAWEASPGRGEARHENAMKRLMDLALDMRVPQRVNDE